MLHGAAGGMHLQSITGLPETPAPQPHGTNTCGHAITECPTAVSLRQAMTGPHPYESLASKAAAQLGDRLGGIEAPPGACQVVFAEEDEPGQALDEHWHRASEQQEAAEQFTVLDKSRPENAAHWPTASGSQLAISQPTSAVGQANPCRAPGSRTEPPMVKKACGSSRQERKPRRRKDLASFDLLDQLDFQWDCSVQAAQPAHPVASIESGTVNSTQPLGLLMGCHSESASDNRILAP